MNLKKTLQLSFLILLTIFPSLVFAYSQQVIPGGENVGIHLDTKYVTIVGFYKVNDRYIGEESGFKLGDAITKINEQDVTSINQMITLIDRVKDEEIHVEVKRQAKTSNITLTLEKDNTGVYKTGLYVKDQINGIGTLSYIDPNTSIYGALGHEIADRNTLQKVELKDGKILESSVTKITPSRDGTPGEKQAKFSQDNIYGNIIKNEESGIFGTFTGKVSSRDAIEVGKPEDVKKGKASIRTVIEKDQIEEFEIEILEIDITNETKNILFQITDNRLLEKTGGIVAGMSGSPIIQNGKLVGAVTHVVVNDTDKGYGIFITTMLEEGEKRSE
ncbi:MAG: SpoIVB peptidase [Bacilli bacterium]|nr:SpoIVB peptidase [Bacilli bacterium]